MLFLKSCNIPIEYYIYIRLNSCFEIFLLTMESFSIYFDLDTFLDVNCNSFESKYVSSDSFEVNVIHADTRESENLEYCSTSSNNSSLEFESFKCCSSIDNTSNIRSRVNKTDNKTECQHLNCQHTTTSTKSGSSELPLSSNIFFRHVPTNVIEFLLFFGKNYLTLLSKAKCK